MSGLESTPPLPKSLPNITNWSTSSWYNLTAWSVNVNRYAPFLEPLVRAGPRLMKHLGLHPTRPDLPDLPDLRNLPDILAPASGTLETAETGFPFNSLPTIPDHMDVAAAAAAIAEAMDASASTAADTATHTSRLSVDGARGLGSVFGYATSKWALTCFLMAFILNRTQIFAATRRRPRLRWPVRLMLRSLPILLLVYQSRQLLQSIQCQTSPDFAELRWGNASKSSDLLFSHSSSFLNSLSSTLLFAAPDEQSCIAVNMIPSDESGSARNLSGSLSRLWPLFGSFCLSQFLEVVSCAIQGRVVAPETGMTLFEQSLAFAEADAVIGNQLGWGLFSKSQPPETSASDPGTTIALSRSMVLRRVNTPPEVLLVAFLSAMTHITSHVLGVFNLQARYRLASTAFWGLCFMGSIVWSAATFDMDDPSSQGLLRFPTVCIVGFVPHVLVLSGILMCAFIYGLALLISAFSPAENGHVASMSFRQRISHAHENMQANVSLSDIRITREMDFYTALLRAGFGAITMASEAVYLNEDRGVSLKQHTWLEEERFKEVEELQRKWIGGGLPDSRYDQVGAIGLIPVKGGPFIASNGYARERAAQKVSKGRGERGLRVGIGAAERSSRWLMALEFLLSINKLLMRLAAKFTLWCLAILRIRYRPGWLRRLARYPKNTEEKSSSRNRRSRTDHQLHSSNSGHGSNINSRDIEAEFRRVSGNQDDASLDKDLYSYWLRGGWWGSDDTSGDFEPHPDEDDFDTTSIMSMSTNGDDTDREDSWESEDDDGQRTPTQQSPRYSRQSTPFVDSPMQIGDLARLLHPTCPEEREEAKTLSAHLQSDGVLTRSKFRRMEQLQRTRILTGTASALLQPGIPAPSPRRNAKLTPEEEEQLLEHLLLSRRQARHIGEGGSATWDQGGSGFGSNGPQCVVCQSSPRTIIVWPCRCLSLCDDCRVSLAMNNFDKCVCCRREVISFSRVFVP